jgi:hypothetical protein
MTILEKIEKMIADARAIRAAHPEITNIWYSFKDLSLVEISEVMSRYPESQKSTPLGHDGVPRVRVQLVLNEYEPGIVCFLHSVPVKVLTPQVEEIVEAA